MNDIDYKSLSKVVNIIVTARSKTMKSGDSTFKESEKTVTHMSDY